jgi:hypothetical protein
MFLHAFKCAEWTQSRNLLYLRESNAHLNFQNLETKKVFAGECNAHRQKVHSLQ